VNKNFLIPLSVVLLFLGLSTEINATSIDDYLVDGKLVVNSIQPTNSDEAKSYITSYLMGHEEVVFSKIIGWESCNSDYSVCEEKYCNSDYSVCEVSIDFSDGSSSTKTVNIVYQPTTNSIVKDKVDSFSNSIGKATKFALNDLEVINYIFFGSGGNSISDITSIVPFSDYVPIRAEMANYSGELKEKLQNSNLVVDYNTGTAVGEGGWFYVEHGGDAVLRYNDIGYGYLDSPRIVQKNVVYVPTDTSPDQYLAVAQKRINDYLGSTNVVLSEGGDLLSLYEGHPDRVEFELNQLMGLGVSDVNQYFILTYGEDEYYFLIIADSTKMLTPSLITQDLITNARITTSFSQIPLDSTIDAKILTSGEEYEEIIEILNKNDVEMYDLKLYTKSLSTYIKKLENGTFEVRIPIPSKLEGKDLVVNYVNSEGKVEEHEVTVNDEYAVFTTNHFSIYTLSEKTSEVNPPTYDGIITWIILGNISLIGLASTVIFRKIYNS